MTQKVTCIVFLIYPKRRYIAADVQLSIQRDENGSFTRRCKIELANYTNISANIDIVSKYRETYAPTNVIQASFSWNSLVCPASVVSIVLLTVCSR